MDFILINYLLHNIKYKLLFCQYFIKKYGKTFKKRKNCDEIINQIISSKRK